MINKSYLNTSTACQLENEAVDGPLIAYVIIITNLGVPGVCMYNIFCLSCEKYVKI